MIAVIVAHTPSGVIGQGGTMPWSYTLKADLARFRRLTLGHTVVMGRRTFESIGHPLPDRANIVLSTAPDFCAEGCQTAHSWAEAVALADAATTLFAIGGASVYAEALQSAQIVYATHIDNEMTGDAYFPKLDPRDWEVTEVSELMRESGLSFTFCTFRRRQ